MLENSLVKKYVSWLSHLLLLFSQSVMSNSLHPHGLQHARLLSFIISQSLLKFMSIRSVMPSNHLIPCHTLLLLPSFFSSIRVFFNESALCIGWSKYWNFSFNISPSSEHPGLIPFTMDWLDLLAVQGPHKCLLQHHNLKHQFFGAQASLWSNSHICI